MFSQASENFYPWQTASHLERRYSDKYVFNLIWRTKEQVWHWSFPSLSTRTTPLPQLPHQHKWDQNQPRSSCCRKRVIKFIQTSICAQAEFLPLHYPELRAAGRLRRWLCHKTSQPGPTFMNEIAVFFSKCETGDHGWVPPFFTKPLGE